MLLIRQAALLEVEREWGDICGKASMWAHTLSHTHGFADNEKCPALLKIPWHSVHSELPHWSHGIGWGLVFGRWWRWRVNVDEFTPWTAPRRFLWNSTPHFWHTSLCNLLILRTHGDFVAAYLWEEISKCVNESITPSIWAIVANKVKWEAGYCTVWAKCSFGCMRWSRSSLRRWKKGVKLWKLISSSPHRADANSCGGTTQTSTLIWK